MKRAALAAAVIVTVAACSSGQAEPTVVAASAPDRIVAGPQGRVAQFVVECAFSRHLADDPIVAPGHPGHSHLHAFFGNVATDASSTATSLARTTTTCNQSADRAAYWAPALLRNGAPIEPLRLVAYYRPGPSVPATSVRPYPFGLVMIAGEAHTDEAQPLAVASWSCGQGIARSATPEPCPARRPLRLIVTFPDCWDGVHVDSDDHRSHVTYSSGGRCPSDHPVPVPQLQLAIDYPVHRDVGGLELSSGGLLGGHADFLNAWDPARLAREVNTCLHRQAVCGVSH